MGIPRNIPDTTPFWELVLLGFGVAAILMVIAEFLEDCYRRGKRK